MKDPQPIHDPERMSAAGDYFQDIAEKIKEAKSPGEAFTAALIAQAMRRAESLASAETVLDAQGQATTQADAQRAAASLDTLEKGFHAKYEPELSSLAIFANKLTALMDNFQGVVTFQGRSTNRYDLDRHTAELGKYIPKEDPSTLRHQEPTAFLLIAHALYTTHRRVISLETVEDTIAGLFREPRLREAVADLLPADYSTWQLDQDSLSINKRVVWEKPDDNM